MIFSLLSLSCTLIRFSMSIQASLFLFRVLSGFTTTRYLYQVFVKTGNLLGRLVMGSSGLEPPTSRLSGARSNLLSYEPVLKSLVVFCLPSARFGFPRFVSSFSLLLSLSSIAEVLSFAFGTDFACPGFRTGDDGIRTHDPLLAGQVLSQLSYTPKGVSLPSQKTHSKLNNKLCFRFLDSTAFT